MSDLMRKKSVQPVSIGVAPARKRRNEKDDPRSVLASGAKGEAIVAGQACHMLEEGGCAGRVLSGNVAIDVQEVVSCLARPNNPHLEASFWLKRASAMTCS